MSKFSLAGEIWLFLRQNKKLWLLPIILVLLIMGALLVFAQTSALAPFIYTIF
jgi:drug/metabolite transporter superfamily protein YnfA